MARGKYVKHTNAKALALMLALVLSIVGVVGGTVAWLIATPDPVVNTFTYGDINITLTETDTGLDGDNKDTTNQYKMIPGEKIPKDPVVTVLKGSEAMYLFVKLEKSANFDEFMEYDMAEKDKWYPVDGADGVYYRWITAAAVADENMEIHLIANDTVTVKSSVTKEMLNALDSGSSATYPTLTVTAYAVQEAGSNTAAEAWAKITANP